MSNEWIKSTDQLPKDNKRYLGYCLNEIGISSWEGIVDVYFDPQIGWRRCENSDEKPLCVLWWREMIESPRVKHER